MAMCIHSLRCTQNLLLGVKLKWWRARLKSARLLKLRSEELS